MDKPRHDWFRVWVFGLLVLNVGGFAAAQDPPPNYFGTADTNYPYADSAD